MRPPQPGGLALDRWHLNIASKRWWKHHLQLLATPTSPLLPQAVGHVPSVTGDNPPSARCGPHSGTRRAGSPRGSWPCAGRWHRQPTGSRRQGSRAKPGSSSTLDGMVRREEGEQHGQKKAALSVWTRVNRLLRVPPGAAHLQGREECCAHGPEGCSPYPGCSGRSGRWAAEGLCPRPARTVRRTGCRTPQPPALGCLPPPESWLGCKPREGRAWHQAMGTLSPPSSAPELVYPMLHPQHPSTCLATGWQGPWGPGCKARVPEQSRDTVPAAPVETPAFHQQRQAHKHSQLPETQLREK